MRSKTSGRNLAIDPASPLYQFIVGEMESLLPTLRRYALKFGLARTVEQAHQVADDLLQDTVVEALEHFTRFDAGQSAQAWLLGIATKLIKQRQQNLGKTQKREPLVRDTYATDQESYSGW